MDIYHGFKQLFYPKGKDTEQSTTHAAAREAEQRSVEEASMAAASGKRAHAADSSSSEARGSKRVKQRGREDDNLTPNYNAHPDARPISMPGRRPYNHEQDWKGQPAASQAAAKRAPSRRGGGFKPLDTLGNSAPQASKGPSIFSSFVHNNPRAAKPSAPTGRPQPVPGRNGNAPRSSPMEHAQDPIEDDTEPQQPAVKKRRMESTVDLTDDDNEDTPVAVGGEKDERRGSAGSQVSNFSKKAKNQTPWAPTERKKIDLYMKVNPGELKLSQADARLPFSPEIQRAFPVANDSRAITIVDDDPPKVTGNDGLSVPSGPRGINPRKRLPIDLTAGFGEAEETVRQKQQGRRKLQQQPGKQPPRAYTEADARNANDLISSAASGRNSKSTRGSQPAASARRSRERNHETNDGTFGNYVRASPSSTAASGTASLQKKFVRDNTPTPKRQTARQRMQTGSQTSPVPTGQATKDDSVDELEGPSTIVKSTSRQVSPVKPSPARSQANGRSPSRQSSPSNIKRSKLTGSKANGLQFLQNPQPETLDVDSLQDASEDELRIPLKAIFSKSICSNMKRLELVWDDNLKAFLVLSGRQVQRNPHNKKLITIGQSDVKICYHTQGYTGAYLKGPMTEISTGCIVLEFEDMDGLSECFNMLQSDDFTAKPLSRGDMEKAFHKQRDEQMEAHKREKSKGSIPALASNQKLMRAAPARQAQREEKEERIMYEEGSPPPTQYSRPARARDRMQTHGADTLTRALDNAGYQNARQSHQNDKTAGYLENDGTRRSTRQAKPVQHAESAPSPIVEKWTKINNPEPWAHPVLYPPQGAKRVTVEFTDLERLDEEEWLNDNLVNYELKHIESQMQSEDREKVHFFNTFFFTSVSTNGNKRGFNYNAVKRWTKNVDIFNIPYLVVPISENLHWFVVVICNLHNLPRKVAGCEDEATLDEHASDAVVDPEPHVAHDVTAAPAEENVQVQRSPVTVAGETGSSPTATEQGVQDDDRATATNAAAEATQGETFTFGEDGRVTGTHKHLTVDEDVPVRSRPSTATSKKSKKKVYAPIKYDPDQPILIALDSFGNPRSAEMKILKQWVAAEAESKRGMQVDWRKLQGMNAKGLPTQLNFSDCGVYLAGYIHEFAKDPQNFITKVMLKELEQENLFADFDPVKKRDDMRNRLLKLHKEQEDERIARKKAKAAAKNATTSQASKVTDVGKTEEAQAQSPPAPRSSPAAPAPRLKSDDDKLLTKGGPAAEQIQQELSSAIAAGEDDLPYEEPLALGAKADRGESSYPPLSSDREPVNDDGDDDEEMLDNEDMPKKPGGFRFPDDFVPKYPSQQAPHVDVYAQDLPVAPTETPAAPLGADQANNLHDLREINTEPTREQQAGDKTVINLEDDDDGPATQQLGPVIPDSQEKENHEEKSDLE